MNEGPHCHSALHPPMSMVRIPMPKTVSGLNSIRVIALTSCLSVCCSVPGRDPALVTLSQTSSGFFVSAV